MLETKTRAYLNYTFFIIQILIVVALINTKRLDYIRDVVFISALAGVYIFLENKYSIYVSNYIRGCVILVIFVHDYAGKYLELYLTLTIFDKLLHVFGIYSVVLFAYAIMNRFMKISFTSKLNEFVFITLLGISLGAIFEILEYIVDVTINPKIHNQPDLTDTDLDMIADVIGAITAAFHVSFIGIQLRLSKNK